MIATSLAQIALDCEGTLGAPGAAEDSIAISADDVVTSVATDNRQVNGGELFVAIKGERIDGNTLANAALLAGAAGVLTSDPETAAASGADPARLVVVDEPIAALGRLARASLARLRAEGNPDLRVVAVTGSVGKTTTKDLLASLLKERGPIIAPPGSFNNELGLPLTVLRATADTATLVLEMGADHVGNLEYLTSIAPPDVSVVLVVARAHLGEFGGIENVALAKSELVSGTRADGVVVLNADDERVAAMAPKAPGVLVRFSAKGQSDAEVRAENVSAQDARASFDLVTPSGSARVDLKLIGEHHVTNALAAAAVADVLGIGVAEIAAVITATGPASPHRMDVDTRGGVTIIDDSYNANPDSMRAGLDALKTLGQGRRTIAVLGAMLELGDASADEHEAIGEYCAGIDVVVAVGEGVAELSKAAFGAGSQVYDAPDTDAALALLSTLLVNGDVLLLKGSNGSGVWRIADSLKEGDS